MTDIEKSQAEFMQWADQSSPVPPRRWQMPNEKLAHELTMLSLRHLAPDDLENQAQIVARVYLAAFSAMKSQLDAGLNPSTEQTRDDE